jgi:thiol-disulfide isomerase/thioredoxin
MRKLESKEQFQALKQEENVIFMFSAEWCIDCRVIEPILPEIMEENNDFSFYYVDRDQFMDLCIEHDIFGIPSFIAFTSGEETGRFVNKDRKTKEQINEFVASLRK